MAIRHTRYGLNILLILLIVGMGYFAVHRFIKNPCSVPKTFSVVSVDPRFGISTGTVALYAEEGALTWNKAYPSNPLLLYATTSGDIKIRLVYDERQRTTLQNEILKQTITEEKNELDDLKQTIESLRAEHSRLETAIAAKTAAYTTHLSKHNTEVAYWNSQNGAPAATYQRLQRDAASLETERASLNASINRYNQLSTRIQAYGRSHNQVVETINTKINTLNGTALREFEEGTYDPNTHEIVIYEYANAIALRRVLLHELGHARGLDHVTDKDAIMYSINQGKNLTLADADKEELARICKDRTFADALTILRSIHDDISHLLVSSWHDIAALLR
jgi:prefoldin subunit 5